ncbi:MAG: ribokinase [Alphaproteobacteria bacterium]|nr:ribokinase [Alphaproteobacteria bacterium]
MLETVLAKIGLPLLMDIVGGALGRINHPVAQSAAKALADTQNAIVAGMISPEAAQEANRHLEKMTELQQQAVSDALSEVNQSLRAEVASDDPYVRRMRPTFGYLMAITWTVQMLSLAYVIVFDTQHASVVLDAISSLSAIWTVALSVLGIYVYKRSEEKTSLPFNAAKSDIAASVPLPARKPRAAFND